MAVDPGDILILDNGGYALKAQMANKGNPRNSPNCIFKSKHERKRVFIGSEIDDMKLLSSLYYMPPFQKGYLLNWDIQRKIWEQLFGKKALNIACEKTCLVVTEPPMNFASISEEMDEVFLEDFQFRQLLRVPTSTLIAYKYALEHKASKACLVVDTGYSFTHILPYWNGKLLKECVQRINIGGKILTNYLKEIISYRQLHVLDETYVINQCKEDACFVTEDFERDMFKATESNGRCPDLAVEYVLPDFSALQRGYVRRQLQKTSSSGKGSALQQAPEQTIRLCNERFAVPELLFHPSDTGIIFDMGIPEAIEYAISQLPSSMHSHMYENIVVCGGSARFPGFRDRVYKEIRALAPDEVTVNVVLPESPENYCWEGGKAFAHDPLFGASIVSKKEYDECGINICRTRFSY